MFYWLFTGGRVLLDSFLIPLLCLTIFAPIVIAALLGVGIQRDDDGPTMKGKRRFYLLTAYVIVSLGVTTLFLALLGNLALTRPTGKPTTNSVILFLNGDPPQINQMRLFLMGALLIMTWFMVSIGLHQIMRNGGWLREHIDRLRRPNTKRGTMGSAHFCTFREYRRYRRQDKDGVTFLGAFWGDAKRRLDHGFGKFGLNGEDAARGILTLGGPGSGKTQGVILPVIADRMLAGHSLVIADPQGEITGHILNFARVTHHLVVIHDPTSAVGPRYNLAEGITNVSDARAIADVLVPSVEGDTKRLSAEAERFESH